MKYVLKYYYKLQCLFSIWIYLKLFLWYKAEFSASLLQYSVSHDPSEIILICWFAAQETFPIIINVEKQLCCLINFFLLETIILF